MNRTHLEEALYDLAYEAGWEFHSAPEASMCSLINSYPTLWLASLKLLEKQGVEHGRIRYGMTLHLLAEGARLGEQSRALRHAKIEEHLLALMASLSENSRVVAIEKLRLTPRTFAFTPHGELAVTAECEVLTCY